jgi:2-dehydropantoate 2-reductase
MRVGVIGAGAVGGTIAALLANEGHSVEVTARGDRLAAVRAHGLRLDGAFGTVTAPVGAGVTLSRSPELAIVATKAQDAAAALSANATMLRGIPLVVVQNGLDGLATAAGAAPRAIGVGGLAMFAASYTAPGTVTVTGGGQVYLGSDRPTPDLASLYAARVLGEVLQVSVLPNFVGAQWTKLVVNQVNALPAITGLSVQEVAASPELLRILTTSMLETVRIGHASGIRFESLQAVSANRLLIFARLPMGLAENLPLRIVARMGSTPNPGSTLQSIRRGQRTEIDYLNGAVVRAAALLGLSAPVNAKLVALVHEVESTGSFLPVAEVVRRIQLAPPR